MKWSASHNIIDFFTEQVSVSPNAVALVFQGESLSYSELHEKSNQLAHHLIEMGVKEGELVPICLNRSINLIVSILGVLKAGGGYVPIDPEYPQTRISYILKNIEAKRVVVGRSTAGLFNIEANPLVIIDLDALSEVIDAPRSCPAVQIADSALAYVLFTSGSTGEPKGVCMAHRALPNLIKWHKNESMFNIGVRTLQFAKLTFDVSFQEIFTTLTTGGPLFLIEPEIAKDPIGLLEFIKKHSILRIFLPFVSLQSLANAADMHRVFPQSLMEVFTAGEQLKITAQVRSLFSNLNKAKLYNQYGPTEAQVIVTQLLLDPSNVDSWPDLPSIGFPIDNVKMLVVDENDKVVETGQEGELCISGICLADGYLNNEVLTDKAFKFIDLSPSENIRIYKTGDIGKILKDGEIIFHGRRDDQVKIRGHRIEMGEIEAVVTKINGVHQAAVVAKSYDDGQRYLVLYYMTDGSSVDQRAIKQYLTENLPEYMLPTIFMKVESFPITSSGKVDRKSLPDPINKRNSFGGIIEKPKTQTEKVMVGIFQKLLNLDEVGINDNFFELGGNSLLAQRLVVEIKGVLGKSLSVTKIYQYPEIKQLTPFLDSPQEDGLDQAASFENRRANTSNGAVAVIGMAGRFPGASDIDTFWENLINEIDSITTFSPDELDKSIPERIKGAPNYVPARGIIKDADQFDYNFFGINPAYAELMDPQHRLFLEIAWEALEKTRIHSKKNRNKIGVFAGTNNNTYFQNNIVFNKKLMERYGEVQVASLNEKDYVATRTAYQFDLHGPAMSVYSACSTSLLAISQAVQNIRARQCEVALAGGSTVTPPINSGHLYQEGAIFSSNAQCKPFDADATGTLFCDGAGVIVLKDFEKAVEDGDTIYAKILGVGINNDGSNKGSFSAPSVEGQAEVIRKALCDAQTPPSDISYVEAHGTATPLGDPIEIEGLKTAFGAQGKSGYCGVGSVKSNVGHLTAAAGVAGFIKTALSLYHQTIPASLGFKRLNPVIDLDSSPFYITGKTGYWKADYPRKAGVSSFGIGGTNVHIILEEYINEELSSDEDTGRPKVITLAAKTEKSLSLYVGKLHDWLEGKESVNLADLAYSVNTKVFDFPYRGYLAFNNREDLLAQLSQRMVPAQARGMIKSVADHVVFLFPGQGAQYLDMGKDLYGANPVFSDALDGCCGLFNLYLDVPLLDVIFPSTMDELAEARLKDTQYTQPAIFAIEYALAKLWMSWGVRPTGFCGHSIGEYVAAHLSGILSLADATKLVAKRGKLVSELSQGDMLSVRAPYDIFEGKLSEGLSIAAVNSPSLCVVAGSSKEIDPLTKKLDEKGILFKKLFTSHAFHSPMMDPILGAFREEVEKVELNPPTIPIYSTVTGLPLKDSEAVDPKYWTNHLRATVQFSAAVTYITMENEEVMFVEVGPGNGLSSLVKQHQTAKGAKLVNSLQRQGIENEYSYLKHQFGQLYVKGGNPDWQRYYSNQKRVLIDVPTYAFDKKKCWIDAPLINEVHDDTVTPSPITSTAPGNITSSEPGGQRKEILMEKLQKIIKDASGIEVGENDRHSSFLEMGLDSLLLTQLAFMFKREFSIPLGFRQLNSEFKTLDLLADHLVESLSKDVNQVAKEVIEAKLSTTNGASVSSVAAMKERHILPNNSSVLENIQQQLNSLTEQIKTLQQQGANISKSTVVDPMTDRSMEIRKRKFTFAKPRLATDQNIEMGYKKAEKNHPPVPGARLGKDDQGNPAWFVPSDQNPGKYLKIPLENA